jgi:outer membrane protein assembly factor BamB
VKGYDLATGKEIWNVNGISRIVNMTPTVGPDNILYVPAWSPGGDDADRIEAPPFDKAIAENDKNGNGMLEPDEVPDGALKQRFDQIDRDKDQHITRAEHESMRNVFEAAKNVLVAIKPGGRGDITTSHVLWTVGAEVPLPYVPSPVFHDGHLYMVRNGGIVSSVDAKTGEPVKKGRISGRGDYYSSPVVGDDKIYFCSQRGNVCVVSAEKEWEELASADFGEDIIPTPAIVDGKIYLRTKNHLYCFGTKE